MKILFVCTGNICRSPSAEAVLKHALNQASKDHNVFVDSAGTHGYHVGDRPDERAIEAAQRRGISMKGITARQVTVSEFDEFDLILAMDEGHYQILQRLNTSTSNASLEMFSDYCTKKKPKDVPDPYYGGQQGFENVLDILEDGVQGLIKTHGL